VTIVSAPLGRLVAKEIDLDQIVADVARDKAEHGTDLARASGFDATARVTRGKAWEANDQPGHCAGDRDFEPLEVATVAAGPLSVGGLLAVGGSGDCVEAWISDEPFDGRHGRSYPGPVWVDVCGDAPRVV
jgi:hypothetical protein